METKIQTRLLALQGNLLNFAYMLTSNRDDAYDLLQDTFVKVLDNEDKYAENVNFKGWVFTIMRNIFINNYRHQVRSATIIDQTEDLYHLNTAKESGIDSVEGAYAAGEITAAINSFPDEYRVPFYQSGIDDIAANSNRLIYNGSEIIAGKDSVIELFNISGIKVADATGTLNVDGLHKGIYIATATNSNGEKQTTKIFVK